MNRLAIRAAPRPCMFPSNPRIPLHGRLPPLYPCSLGVNYVPLHSQLSASRRQASTGTGTGTGKLRPPRTLRAKLEKTFNVLEKLQTLSNGNSPDIIGSIIVGNNEGLLFFDSAFALTFFHTNYARIVLILP